MFSLGMGCSVKHSLPDGHLKDVMNATRMLPHAAAVVWLAALNACLAHAQLVITTSSLPPSTSGTAYSATLSATGGTLPYTWSLPSGGLPQALIFNPGSPTATITGIPAAIASVGAIIDPLPIRFQVTDSAGLTATASLPLNIANPIVVTTTALPPGSLGMSYFSCLSATGGSLAAGEFWAITAGALPTGLTLGINQSCPGFGPAPSAALSGTPAQAGNFNVTVQVGDAQNRTGQMSYTLTVGGGPTTASLNAGPSALSAGYTIGQTAPAAQVLQISSTGAPLAYNASISYVQGSSGNSDWVGLTNPSGITPATVGVSLMPSGLPAGVYKANIAIGSSASNGPVSVPVTLTVTSGVTLILSPPAVTFTYVQGGAVPPPQQVQFTASSGSLSYSFSVNSGANWLTAIPPGGVNPSTLALMVNPAGLSPGTYMATIAVSASGAVNSPQSLGVTLLVEGGTPTIASLLNAASLEVGALSPGSIVTIKGSALGPATGVSMQPDAKGNYGTTLAGVQVLFNGAAGPMLYAQSGQINAVVPFEIGGTSSATVQVVYNNMPSASYSLPMQQAAPALFTASASGTGQGAILNQDSTVNSSSNPAAAGTIVSLFGTGGGLFQTAGGDGTTAVVTNLVLPVTAQVGGANAQVLYAGSAPGLVAGGVQINVKIPAGTPAGDVPVVVFVGGLASQSPVTVAVR